MLTRRSSRTPSSNWEKGKGEGRGRKEERNGKGEGKGKGVGREGSGKKEGRGRGKEEKGAPADFRYIAIQPSLNTGFKRPLSREGSTTWRVEEGEKRKGKGEIRNGGVALASRENFLRAPMLQFISTKLVYR